MWHDFVINHTVLAQVSIWVFSGLVVMCLPKTWMSTQSERAYQAKLVAEQQRINDYVTRYSRAY